MTMAAPTLMAARRKNKWNRHYASTLVHYLGIEEALEVCRERMWHGIRDEILQRHPLSTRSGGAGSQAP